MKQVDALVSATSCGGWSLPRDFPGCCLCLSHSCKHLLQPKSLSLGCPCGLPTSLELPCPLSLLAKVMLVLPKAK